MFLYTALGDSITAGENATSPLHAYPSLVVSLLQSRSDSAAGEVLAQPGWTSEALEMAVLENAPLYLRQANAISVWVGGDDLLDGALSMLHGAPRQTLQRSLALYGRNIAGLVLAIRSVSRAPVILCTQYNPFPNSPIATEAVDALNQITAGVSSRLGARLAPVHTWFEGRQASLIAGYRSGRIEDALATAAVPLHPNNRGHRVVARGLLGMIGPPRIALRTASKSANSWWILGHKQRGTLTQS